jgi:hypothetical protein
MAKKDHPNDTRRPNPRSRQRARVMATRKAGSLVRQGNKHGNSRPDHPASD